MFGSDGQPGEQVAAWPLAVARSAVSPCLNSLIARVDGVTLIAREIKELMWSRKRRNASSEGPKQS